MRLVKILSHKLNCIILLVNFPIQTFFDIVSHFLVYLQIREPFSVMSLVKSPMGLMMGFMLIVLFVMPKLMENMGTVLFNLIYEFSTRL